MTINTAVNIISMLEITDENRMMKTGRMEA